MKKSSGIIHPPNGDSKKWRVPYEEDGEQKECEFDSADEAVMFIVDIRRAEIAEVYHHMEKITGVPWKGRDHGG